MTCCPCRSKVVPFTDPLDQAPVTPYWLQGQYGAEGLANYVPAIRRHIADRGCAHAARRDLWPQLLGIVPWECPDTEGFWKQRAQTYLELKARLSTVEQISEQRQRDLRTIESDVPRTVELKELQPELLEPLRHVLRCYVLFDGSKGYFQGLNEVAGLMVWVMDGDESKAFWCFERLIDRHLNTLGPDFPQGVWSKVQVIGHLLEHIEPELYQQLLSCTEGSHEWVWMLPTVMLMLEREMKSMHHIARIWESIWACSVEYANYDMLLVATLLKMHKSDLMGQPDLSDLVVYINGLRGTIEATELLTHAKKLLQQVRVNAKLLEVLQQNV